MNLIAFMYIVAIVSFGDIYSIASVTPLSTPNNVLSTVWQSPATSNKSKQTKLLFIVTTTRDATANPANCLQGNANGNSCSLRSAFYACSTALTNFLSSSRRECSIHFSPTLRSTSRVTSTIPGLLHLPYYSMPRQ